MEATAIVETESNFALQLAMDLPRLICRREKLGYVHCLRHQLVGRWHFFLGPAQKDLTVGSDGLQRNVSRCGETQLGWYRNEPGTAWGCFYGKKLEPVPEDWICRSVRTAPGTNQWTLKTAL
eukprot:Skav230372  [mRNA]  locus=scaffold2874:147176:154819:- [translate_table: standard]